MKNKRRNLITMENKKWTREEAEQNKNNLLNELNELPVSKENLDWVKKELDQLIDEEEVRQITPLSN
jgi:hypothetical protein